MKNGSLPALFVAALGVCAVSRANAIEAVPTDDTYTSSTTANGAGTTLVVKYSATAPQKAWIRFHLKEGTNPPPNPQSQAYDGPLPVETKTHKIWKATLRVFVNTLATGPVNLTVKRVTSAWDEAALKSNTAPFPTIGAALPGVLQISTPDKYAYFDITSLVQEWVAGTQLNYGLVIESTGGTGTVTLDSKENQANAKPPVIQIALEPEYVINRGDVSMGIFMAGPQP